MVIQHNISSLNAWRNTKLNNNSASKNMEKLSSGTRINRAADDAAGLAISEKMRGQIRGLSQAKKNISDGISLTQTIDGAMQTDHDILQRMRELLVQASNGTYNDSDRQVLQGEIDQLMQEIDDLSYRAEFNDLKALRTNWVEVVEPSTTPGTTVIAVLPPQYNDNYSTQYGYIDVPAGGDFFINFNNLQTTSTWPDMNIIAPNGEKFGYTWTYLSSGSACSTTGASSCGLAQYTGYSPPNGTTDEERYTFTNAMAGKWTIVLRNAQGNSSTFNLNSNLTIVPYATGTGGNVSEPVITTKEPGPIYIQAGANQDETILIPISTIDTHTLGLRDKNGDSSIGVTPVSKAAESISLVNDAINFISGKRADIGAVENRLKHALNNVGSTRENLQSAESSIRDVDMAKEMMGFTKNNILVQAAQSMFAQANQLPQGVLSLLR